MSKEVTGSCNCKSVTFTVTGALRPVVACHCTQCRKQSGHYFAATSADDNDLHITGEEHLTWYQASPEAKRGFCQHCGSALFWKHLSEPKTSILAGSLDGKTDLKIAKHIFVADKGDYYDLEEGIPRFDAS